MRNDYVLAVRELNGYVKGMLESDPMLKNVRVRGEISNLSRPGFSGHLYFTLKDESAQLKCVMFRQDAVRLSMRPIDGQRVIAQGYCSLYPERGEFQLYVKAMRPDGIGSLYEQFEALKQRLQAEGLFDASRKRVLPVRPKKIAVVTAATGAVIHDVCRVAGARDASVPIVLVPTKVQGEGAAAEIAAALRKAAKVPEVDVIILCRGGGSLEDLWAFNEETVARAIAACPIPVVSGVGHETDTTIADFVADVRASTPSNAAELVVPTRAEMLNALALAERRLHRVMEQRLSSYETSLLRLNNRLQNNHPEKRLVLLQGRLEKVSLALSRTADQRLAAEAAKVQQLSQRLEQAADKRLQAETNRLEKYHIRLETLNPKAVLERGYALVTDGDNVVSSAQTAEQQSSLYISFRDGTVKAVPDVKR